MTTVSSTQLISLLLNAGSGGEAPALPLELQMTASASGSPLPGILPAELMDALAAEEGGAEFLQLIQQKLLPDDTLSVAEPQADDAEFFPVFNGLPAVELPVDRQPQATEPLPVMESASNDRAAEEEAPDAAPLAVAVPLPADPGPQPVPVVTDAIPREIRPLPRVRLATEAPAVPVAEAGNEGGDLPPGWQAATAGTRSAVMDGAETLAMPEQAPPAPGRAAAVLKPESGTFDAQPPAGKATAGRVESAAVTQDGTKEGSEDAPEVPWRLKTETRDEPPALREAATARPIDALRNEAAAQRTEAPQAAAAAMPRVTEGGDRGMNELPPELRQMTLSPRAGEQAWGREMGERVGFLLHNNLKQAEIRLDPPHLGKLEIQLQVQDDKAVVHIHAQTVQTRDLIDGSLMRLRDALQDAGYSQVDVQVSQRDASAGEQGDGRHGSGQGTSGGNDSALSSASEAAVQAAATRRQIELTARMLGGIDTFA